MSVAGTATGRPRILLVSTNRERAPYPVLPNGMACVASALAGAGHDVRIAALMFERDAASAAARAAREYRPDVIGEEDCSRPGAEQLCRGRSTAAAPNRTSADDRTTAGT
jgi:hypothetical protein